VKRRENEFANEEFV